MKSIRIYVQSEDGKKAYQDYRPGVSRTSLIKHKDVSARVLMVVIDDEGDIVLMCEGGEQVVYKNCAARYLA